jgi:segregation and condensation protein A
MANESVVTTSMGSKTALDEAFVGMPNAAGGSLDGGVPDDYRVNVPAFEGPLDLLLHLIRKDQIDIYDIPIAHICQSYLEYIHLLERPDVNLAGEFMVMAATLMHLKSIMLLPCEKPEEEDDPRLPLVAQLLEYEKYKKMSEIFNARPWRDRDVYGRPEGACKDIIPAESLLSAAVEPVEAYQMLIALKIALDRTTKPHLDVSTDPISIRAKVGEIEHAMESADVVELAHFIPTISQERRREIIIAFLAVLELARLGFIEILQHENFGPIQIRKRRSLGELNVTLLDQF